MNNNQKTIAQLLDNLGYADLESLRIVLKEWSDAYKPEIMDDGVGFNQNSGYVYIALENGIQIASCFGQDADFIVTDFESGEENFFDTYIDAEEFLTKN